jgi:hypothetical protein
VHNQPLQIDKIIRFFGTNQTIIRNSLQIAARAGGNQLPIAAMVDHEATVLNDRFDGIQKPVL